MGTKKGLTGRAASRLKCLQTFNSLWLVMFLGRLDGLDPRIRTQRGLRIGNISVIVGMVEPPMIKGGYCLQNGLLPNIRVGYGSLAASLFLFGSMK